MKIKEINDVLGNAKEIDGELETKSIFLKLNGVYQAEKGKITVIAAEAGKGKSKLMTAYALNDSAKGYKVLFLSSEMKGKELDNLFDDVIIEEVEDEISLAVGETESPLTSENITHLVLSYLNEGYEVDKVYVDHFVLEENQSLQDALNQLDKLDVKIILSTQLALEPKPA